MGEGGTYKIGKVPEKSGFSLYNGGRGGRGIENVSLGVGERVAGEQERVGGDGDRRRMMFN